MRGPTRSEPQKKIVNSKNSGRQKPEILYLAVGRIVKPHGVHGEVSMTVLTDFPERFETTTEFYLGDEHEADLYELESFRWHKQHLLLKFKGVADRNDAEELRGLLVQIPIAEATPLPEGSYYLYQLIGLQVITIDGERLGTVDSIIETGANDVYVVKNDAKKELLLPAIPDVVKSVDLEAKQITVELMDGLI